MVSLVFLSFFPVQEQDEESHSEETDDADVDHIVDSRVVLKQGL